MTYPIDTGLVCADCGCHIMCDPQNCSTGYGYDAQHRYVCFKCCAVTDVKAMIEHGHSKHLPLYLGGRYITNWPGTLRFTVMEQRETHHHNIAGRRRDVWFRGPDGYVWHGTQFGGNTQIVHCKRTKELSRAESSPAIWTYRDQPKEQPAC